MPFSSRVKRSCSFFKVWTTPASFVIESPSRRIVTVELALLYPAIYKTPTLSCGLVSFPFLCVLLGVRYVALGRFRRHPLRGVAGGCGLAECPGFEGCLGWDALDSAGRLLRALLLRFSIR